MSQNVLTIANATLTYPDGTRSVAALDHVSLQARAGQLTAIVGESGSGKSTVLSAAAGLAVPDSGTITVAGLVLSDAPEATRTRIRRDHIGMIFQSPNLLASLTVAEQLLITSHIRGQRPGRRERERAAQLLELVGLAGMGGRRVHQLSGGQRQRVTIARALMGSPELLLADEPTSALDARRSREIVTLLREVTDSTGVATVMVTHDRSHLYVADAVVTMSDGSAQVSTVEREGEVALVGGRSA
ncbi:ABC transporter ATP-binding protein [Corynebacterium uberis]|uniref:ABC transporter ATP-binding protein n=1 Tax=Corynebacterium TaxID=1716 RepID=UPI001D0B62A8|nr:MULTISPECIES: ABC transporter ATP-binding protein [Corynebacterium]MCZ9310318.1 ABC transporter ATP-binding protein [Corynebacterium sp. c6VSa_13]UDL73346.1 ABC transporter ATP-binding protein [Corynebacterium uberis]UDL75776.1 ABC transporter ATP-binding protein [Corynebacterium uberis]UDL77988.1 ABC transporter ATP-binding protein [Corynebacterium uberis]UDL80271.1 ABC transporter ATP-binding protein [Corynebacterium uberis]